LTNTSHAGSDHGWNRPATNGFSSSANAPPPTILRVKNMADYSPYQQKIIDRYYRNFDAIKSQRLSELATELYLSEGKKRDRLWTQVEQLLHKLEVPESRVAHIMSKRDPALLVGLLKEIEPKK
jgi:hypothetical protein